MPYKDIKDQARWRSEHPDYARDRNLRLNYNGFTLEDFNEMAESQGWACKICGKIPDPEARHNQSVLHVDHNHRTGKVRGLLCANCNRGIGMLGDDPDTLSRAAAYLAGR